MRKAGGACRSHIHDQLATNFLTVPPLVFNDTNNILSYLQLLLAKGRANHSNVPCYFLQDTPFPVAMVKI